MATTYQLQVSTVNTFATTVYDQSLLTTVAPTVDTLTKGTKYYWRVRATVDLVVGAWSAIFDFTLAASTLPIWEQITNEIKTAIQAMSVGGGYNFDYGDVDDYLPASRVYPAVLTRFPTQTAIDADMVDKITHDTDIMFTVLFSSTETSTSRDDAIDKAIDDFKRMFSAYLNTLRPVGMISYTYTGAERRYTLVAARPCEVDIKFKILWRQNRNTPSTT